jgi:hypothetical protein
MSEGSPIYRAIQQTLANGSEGWFWFLDWSQEVHTANGLVGPFRSEDEALRHAKETLRIVDDERLH